VDLSVVQEVVRVLKARGERVSVRAVHGVTGGSFRDVSRLLRDAREFLDEDEAAALEADAEPEPLMPAKPLGEINKMRRSILAARDAISENGNILSARRARLRDLQLHPPLPLTDAAEVDSYLEAKMDHHLEMAREVDAIRELEKLQAVREAKRDRLLEKHALLQQEADDLDRLHLPDARKTLESLQQRIIQLRQDLTVTERQVERQQRLVASYEHRLQDLTWASMSQGEWR
jgi:hypothetical protein